MQLDGVIQAATVAWLIGAGVVLALFASDVMPTDYLWRPLIVWAVISVVLGLLSQFAGRWSVAAAGAAALLIAIPSLVTLAIAVAAFTAVWYAKSDLARPIFVAAAVFMLGGVYQAAPLMSFSFGVPAQASEDAPPAYLILLDGYPRADTLAELGVDIGPFIRQLEQRGFTHYPDAHTLHGWTRRTLTAMLTGEIGPDTAGHDKQRAMRESWRLPTGFAYVAPPIGSVTIPGAMRVEPGGITEFEVSLLSASAARQLVGGFIMDRLRDRVDSGLDVIADHDRVFAHIIAPHPPFLYGLDGDPLPLPACWPGCNLFTSPIENNGLTVDEWAAGMAGTLAYLNPRLLWVVDAVLARHPDAAIGIFADHGGRMTSADRDEWNRPFLAVRGPGVSPPRPDVLFRVLTERSTSPTP